MRYYVYEISADGLVREPTTRHWRVFDDYSDLDEVESAVRRARADNPEVRGMNLVVLMKPERG